MKLNSRLLHFNKNNNGKLQPDSANRYLQVYSKSGPSHFPLWSKSGAHVGEKGALEVLQNNNNNKKNCFQAANSRGRECSTRCLCSSNENSGRRLPRTTHQSADIWSRIQAQASAELQEKTLPYLWTGGCLTETARRKSEAERESVCGWVDGRMDGQTGGGWRGPSPVSRAQHRPGAHITFRWPPLSLEIFQLGGESFSFSSPNLCLLHLLAAFRHAEIVQSGMIGPPWITAVARMPTSSIPLKSPGSVFGMNGDVALWWCLFCVNGVKWQPCGVD